MTISLMTRSLTIIFILGFQAATAQIITSVAGSDTTAAFSGDNGPATAAKLYLPEFTAVDTHGNIYISETDNGRIRKVDAAGIITTIAGTGIPGFNTDGIPAVDAKINGPAGIVVDNAGNIYFSDYANNRIRKINTAGIISTIAGTGSNGDDGDNGPATAAQIKSPRCITMDNSGNIYFTDFSASRVRKIDAAGIITNIAGTGVAGYSGDTGPATAAQLYWPYGVAVDGSGNVYVGDQGNDRVRKIDAATGIITTFAGTGGPGLPGPSGDGGPATAAVVVPGAIAVDISGDVYITNMATIRKVNTVGTINTVAGVFITSGFSGDGGPATAAHLNNASDIALDNHGNFYIADQHNNRIRYVTGTLAVNTINNNPEGIKVYPNPTHGQFTINVTSATAGQVQVAITNILGRKVKEMTIATNKPAQLQLDEPAGLYIIEAITTHRLLQDKIVVE